MARLFFTLEFLIKSITIPTLMFKKVESDIFLKTCISVSLEHWRVLLKMWTKKWIIINLIIWIGVLVSWYWYFQEIELL